MALGAAHGASAQSVSDRPFSAPLVGNAPIRSVEPARLTIVPSARLSYDSNALRNSPFTGPRDNVRVTPGIDLNYRRQFGRINVGVSGSAGYDFNSRFKFLDQSRITVNGVLGARVGGTCAINGKASYNRMTFDINDTQARAGSTSTTQIYNLQASCTRGGGFGATGGVGYRSLDASGTSLFSYRQYSENVGVTYSRPSIGTLTLYGSAVQLRRPNFATVVGFSDDTDVYSLTLMLDRAVAPRLRFNAGVGVTKANPRRASVPDFVGASYNGQVTWLPSPRLIVTGTLSREVSSQSGISATYVVLEQYGLGAKLQLSAKSRIDLGANRALRDFRGGTVIPNLQPLRSDRSDNVSANYNYDLSRGLRIGLGVSQRWRKADNPFFNYTSTVVSTSIGARF